MSSTTTSTSSDVLIAESNYSTNLTNNYNQEMADIAIIEQNSEDIMAYEEAIWNIAKNANKTSADYSWIQKYLTEEQIQFCEDGGIVIITIGGNMSSDQNYIIYCEPATDAEGNIIDENHDGEPDSYVWYKSFVSFDAMSPFYANQDKLQNAVDGYNQALLGCTDPNSYDPENPGGALGAEQDLLAINSSYEDASNEMSNLLRTLNQLLLDTLDLGFTGGSSETMAEKVQDVESYMDSIFKAMKQQARIDYDMAVLADDSLSVEDMQKFANDLAGTQTQELATLSALQNKITADFKKYGEELDDVRLDHTGAQAKYAKSLATDGNAQGKRTETRLEMHALSAMFDLMGSCLGSLAGVCASLQPEFMQLEFLFKSVRAEVDAILADDSLSLSEKVSSVMGLLVFLLGYMDVAKGIAEDAMSKQQKKMTEGNVDASKMNLHRVEIDQKIMEISEEMKKFAKTMKSVMLAAEVVVAAACVLLAAATGGAGITLAVAAISAMQLLMSTDVIHFDPVDYISQQTGCSKVEAEVIVSTVEIGMAILGGMALEMAIDAAFAMCAKKAVTVAVETAVDDTIEETLELTATRVIESAGYGSDSQEGFIALNETINVLEAAARQTSEASAKLAIKQFTRQTAMTLFTSLFDGSLNQSIQRAAQEGAKRGLQESVFIAEQAARQAVARGAIQGGMNELVLQEIAQMAQRTSTQVVADLANLEPETLMTAVDQSFNALVSKSWKRFWTSALFTTALNNVYADSLGLAITANGHSKKSNFYRGWMIAAQVFQGGLQMGALSASSTLGGAESRAYYLAASTGALLQTIGMGGQSVSHFGQGMAAIMQGIIAKEVDITKIGSEFLKMMLDSSQEMNDVQRKAVQSELVKSLNLTQDIAQHVADGARVGAQVLAAAAV